MGIDPLLYEKYSGRKGDPYTRLGHVLAKDAKAKQQRDAMPKGLTGGLKVNRQPGIFAQVWLWFKNRARERGNRAAGVPPRPGRGLSGPDAGGVPRLCRPGHSRAAVRDAQGRA